METGDDYIQQRLDEAMRRIYVCSRCDVAMWMSDGRCGLCGMDPRDEGPRPIRSDRPIGISGHAH